MRSAMRTVENLWEMNSAVLPAVSSAKRRKTLEFAARVERSRWLIQDEKLRVAQIGARQRQFLPLAAGKIDSRLEAAAQHLVVTPGKPLHHFIGQALACRPVEKFPIVEFLDASDGDVLSGGHLVAHEVLEDDADLAIQVLQVVLAKVHAVEQDLSLGRVIEPRNQLHNRGLALPVFADHGHAFAGMQAEVQPLENHAAGTRITKRHVAELEPLLDGPRRGQRVGLGSDRRLHLEEGQQVGEEQGLVGDTG